MNTEVHLDVSQKFQELQSLDQTQAPTDPQEVAQQKRLHNPGTQSRVLDLVQQENQAVSGR